MSGSPTWALRDTEFAGTATLHVSHEERVLCCCPIESKAEIWWGWRESNPRPKV
jgi:hypothetical protein